MQRVLVVLIGLFLAAAVWGPGSRVAAAQSAAPQATAALAATADGFVSTDAPTATFDNQPLLFSVAAPFDVEEGAYCPLITHITYVQFDLAGVAFAIDKARLVLDAGACGGEAPLALQLLATTAEWDETTLTWATQPPAEFALPEIGALGLSGRYSWTDAEADGRVGLADWLAFQQSLGVARVTLALTTNLPMGCSLQPMPAVSVSFVDRAGNRPSGRGCGTDLQPPQLQLASADAQLPDETLQPTAVALAAAAARQSVSTLWAWAVLLALITGAALGVRRPIA